MFLHLLFHSIKLQLKKWGHKNQKERKFASEASHRKKKLKIIAEEILDFLDVGV